MHDERSAPRIACASCALVFLILATSAPGSAQLAREGSMHLSPLDFLVESAPHDHFGGVLARGDFNHDGFDDVAFGIADANLDDGNSVDAGRLLVVYGSVDGLVATPTIFSQDTDFIADSPEPIDAFGASLAVGDFDGDGCDDLAVGIPAENYLWDGSLLHGGAVSVLYGCVGNGGLSGFGSQFWRLGFDGLDPPDGGAQFGHTLVAADFDGDGADDLAIAAPFYDTAKNVFSNGNVHILYGVVGIGLHQFRYQVIDQADLTGNPGQNDDNFGLTLAAGDFDGDQRAELVIGVPNDDVNLFSDAGSLWVLRGTVNGVSTAEVQFWSEGSPQVPGSPYEEDYFAAALATGDFDGDGTEDLAIGVPGEPLFDPEGTPFHGVGRVRVLWGAQGLGLTSLESVSFTGYGLTGALTQQERFGTSLVAADFDQDGKTDLAVGAPDSAVDGVADAGAVYIAGGRSDRTFVLQTILDQGLDVPGAPDTDHEFGLAAVAGDFDGDGDNDLVVGNPSYGLENIGSVVLFESKMIGTIFSDGFESGDSNGWSETVLE